MDINPMPDAEHPVVSQDFRDIFIVKLNASTLSIPGEELPGFEAYPNPTSGMVNLQGLPGHDMMFTVSDMAGRRVLSGNLGTSHQIDLTGLKTGVYLISIGSQTLKMVRN